MATECFCATKRPEKSWPLQLLLVNARDLRMAHPCLPRQQQAAGDVKQRAECWLNSAQPGVSIIDLRPQAAQVYRTRSWAARTSAGTPSFSRCMPPSW